MANNSLLIFEIRTGPTLRWEEEKEYCPVRNRKQVFLGAIVAMYVLCSSQLSHWKGT